MPVTRRQFIQRSTAAALTSALLTPPESAKAASERAVAASISHVQWQLIAALGEAIVPGSRSAGLVEFLQRQLSNPPHQALLMVRYLGLPLTPQEFYGSLAAQLSKVASTDNHPYEATQLAHQMATDSVAGWQGLPASLYHFVLRSDGCDIVYGTPAGSRLLGLEYMAHISPPEVM